jgi:hypothetical protein
LFYALRSEEAKGDKYLGHECTNGYVGKRGDVTFVIIDWKNPTIDGENTNKSKNNV